MPIIDVNFANLIGPWLLGVIGSTFLSGIVFCQIAHTFNYRNRLTSRLDLAAVLTTSLLSLLKLVGWGVVAWWFFVGSFGQPAAFMTLKNAAIPFVLTCMQVNMTVCSAYFSRNCCRLWKSPKPLVSGLAFACALNLASGLAYGSLLGLIGTANDADMAMRVQQYRYALGVTRFASAITNVVLCIAITWRVLKTKRESTLGARIAELTVTNVAVPAIFATLSFILFVVDNAASRAAVTLIAVQDVAYTICLLYAVNDDLVADTQTSPLLPLARPSSEVTATSSSPFDDEKERLDSPLV